MFRRPTALFALVAFASVAALAATPRTWSFSTATMGTVATIGIVGPDSAQVAGPAYRALVNFHRADSLLSNWTATSAIARVNREAAAGPVELGPELTRILDTANTIHEASAGAFDPTIEPLVRAWGFLGGEPHVPGDREFARASQLVGWSNVELRGATVRFRQPEVRLDLGGIAKGFAVDQAAALLDGEGLPSFLIDLSGNMILRGAPAGREAWRVGVRDPLDRVDHLGTLDLSDVAIATSGDYEQFVAADGQRYGHILDPRTGRPVDGMAQVTVIAPTAMLADAWATALFVLGAEEGRRIAAEYEELHCILVERNANGALEMWIERDLHSAYAPHPEMEGLTPVHWF